MVSNADEYYSNIRVLLRLNRKSWKLHELKEKKINDKTDFVSNSFPLFVASQLIIG